MPPRDHFEATVDQIIALFGELQNTSDRVTAITCAAFLDDTLGAALMARFVRVGVEWKERIFTGTNAPLGTFYSKTIAGYALGLFGPQTYTDLAIIRTIRNDFAHTPAPLRFTDTVIASKCARLKTPGRIELGLGSPFSTETGPKAIYAQTVFHIASHLLGPVRVKPPPSRPSFPSGLP
jgi:hypothetical protein